MRISIVIRYATLWATVLLCSSPFRATAQFRDDFDGAAIDTSIWMVHTSPDFSITQAGGVLTFDADDLTDDGDPSFPDDNFDNQWDKAYMVSTPFPRVSDSVATQISFEATVPVQSTAWYIGVMPEGTNPAIDPQNKYAYAWHYFWLGGGNNFFTFQGGPTWANPVASLNQDPENGQFRITLDPVRGALWEIHDGADWQPHWDQLGADSFDTSANYQVLINYDGDENDLVVHYVEVQVGGVSAVNAAGNWVFY